MPSPYELEPEVRLLNAISRTLAAPGSPAEVMQQCLKALCPVIEATYGLVMTMGARGSSLDVLASHNVPEAAQAELERAFGGAAGFRWALAAFHSASPVISDGVGETANRSLAADVAARLGMGRTIFLPLQFDGASLLGGVVLCFAGPGEFSEAELRLLWACAEQMAIAYDVALDRQSLRDALLRSQDLEASLRASEGRLRAIVSNSSDVIFIKDLEGRYVFANPHAAAAVGLTPETMEGRLDDEIWDPDVARGRQSEDEQVIRERRAMVFERMVPTVSGAMVFEASKVPLYGVDGNLAGVLTLSRDVTERIERDRLQKDQIAKLQELDRLKDHFLSAASHELRTPLSSIVGYAEFLEDELEGPLTAFQREYVRNIQTSAEHLQRLVADMLDFARLEAGTFDFTFKRADLLDAVRETVGRMLPLAIKAGMTLDVDIPVEPLEFSMDADRVTQILQNLIGNAIKFTPGGGQILVTVEPGSDLVTVRVKDTGIGIEPSHIPFIFQRFFQADPTSTRQHGGAGLGLSIAKALVEAHGGEIGVESQPGSGSTFWFTLSRQRA